MTAVVIRFPSLDATPDEVLGEASGCLEQAAVIGYDGDGELYVASSGMTNGELLWLLERSKKYLLEQEE